MTGARRARVRCQAVRAAAGQHANAAPVGAATMSVGLERLDVRRLGTLGPGLGLVADLRALGERLEAVAGDATVMHEQVLALIVRCDEPEALLVAEPLHGSGCHLFPP